MKRCCNFYCGNGVSDEDLRKGQALKFIVNKEGCSKVDQEVCFCDGAADTSVSCKKEYERIRKMVLHENEGGPFGTPMRNLVDFLRRYEDCERVYLSDRNKIKKLLGEFDEELNKVSAPIQERFDTV